MSLTDVAVRTAKPAEKPQKLFDSGGLYIEIAPSGGKWWRFKYRFAGKEKRISLGTYPEVSLKEARERRDTSRKLLANGVDPSQNRKIQNAAKIKQSTDSFEHIAREWFSKRAPGWAQSHADKIIQRLTKDIFPWLGARSISEITAPELLTVLRRIEERGALDTAHRALQNCGQIFRYAVVTGRAERDPSGDLRGALPPARHENFPSLTDPSEVGELLRAIDAFKGTFVVRCALLLAPLVFLRPGELRKAEWTEFNLDSNEWVLPSERRKLPMSKKGKHEYDHIIPLSTQAVAILKALHPLTAHEGFVFPGRDPKKPMSEAAVNAALRRMGYDTKTEITGHGFRAMARTILHEELHFKPEVIEHQLAHKVPDALGTAYNRTKFLKERQIMMQAWANYLETLKAS